MKTNTLLSIFKAYDSIWREALFGKLEKMGFGGKTLSLIKSMYANDLIKFNVNGNYTEAISLTQGVKQGNNNKN